MTEAEVAGPDDTAITVALWRAVHVLRHRPPHVLDDVLGMRLVGPQPGWEDGPHVGSFVDPWIASVVARSRFAEDLVAEALRQGVSQYVILGAGLDTFALRRGDLLRSGLRLYEVDVRATQDWKLRRIRDLGLDVPPTCRFVDVDFESGESWLVPLVEAGFDAAAPAVVASLGVTQYLSVDATSDNLRLAASLPRRSRYLCTFIIEPALLKEPDRTLVDRTRARASDSPFPWRSVFSPDSFLTLFREAGFGDVDVLTPQQLAHQYFAGRTDGVRPCSGEAIAIGAVSP
jgi:methyltransferase (TIGR00027 family)